MLSLQIFQFKMGTEVKKQALRQLQLHHMIIIHIQFNNKDWTHYSRGLYWDWFVSLQSWSCPACLHMFSGSWIIHSTVCHVDPTLYTEQSFNYKNSENCSRNLKIPSLQMVSLRLNIFYRAIYIPQQFPIHATLNILSLLNQTKLHSAQLR